MTQKAIWITGVPAAGKTTLGQAVFDRLEAPALFLDADEIRNKFWPHLGLSESDRNANVLSLSMIGRACLVAGNNVVIACIAPNRDLRNHALDLLADGGIGVKVCQVCVTAPLAILRYRDPKGLYKKHSEGLIQGLTGVDAPYEEPHKSRALTLDTSTMSVNQAVCSVLDYVERTTSSIPRGERVDADWVSLGRGEA